MALCFLPLPELLNRAGVSVICGGVLVSTTGYLTWEWRRQIRGYLHPLLFVPAYWLVDQLGLANTDALVRITSANAVRRWPTLSRALAAQVAPPPDQVWAPYVVQAAIAALGDLYVYRLAHKVGGPQAARYAVRRAL